MARQQKHRGLAPGDDECFAAKELPALRTAAAELCWLLDRGYAPRSAIELVGNRHTLTERQRMALGRCACSQEDAALRNSKRVEPEQSRGRELWIDGYNVLTLLESALAGGIVLLGRDGCYRDIAGIHRRYRKMDETLEVLGFIGETAAALGVTCCRWYLDKPVSNSGRLKTLILETARTAGWNVSVDLTFSPNHVLSHTAEIVASSDGIILERCQRWVNLVGHIVGERVPKARVVELI